MGAGERLWAGGRFPAYVCPLALLFVVGVVILAAL